MSDSTVQTTRHHLLTTSTGEKFEFTETETSLPAKSASGVLTDAESDILQGLLTVHQDLVYSFDSDYRFTFANQALLNLWGLTREQAFGKSLAEIGYPQCLIELHHAQLKIAFEGKTIRGENPFQSHTGQNGHYEYIFAPVAGPDGKVKSVIGITRDVTQHKRLEEERERLLYAIAHDLRSPLSVISTGTHLLEHGPDEEILQTIRSNTQRAILLVEDLLDSSRIRAGESLQLRRASTNLRELCRNLVEELKILHSNPFILKLPSPEVPCIAQVDPQAILRILANLTTNAAKYGKFNCPVTITLSAGAGNSFDLSVQNDCEEPIPAKRLERFFKPFWRADAGESEPQVRGWGIGLSTSLQLALAHGGEINAQSEVESGTVFTLTIPA